MSIEMLLPLIKPYLPGLTEKVLPMLNQEIAKVLCQADEERVGDEAESVIMLSRDGEEVYLRLVRLNTNGQVTRATEPTKVSTYLENILKQVIGG